jgi:glyoxylase-like metal-dependent hydrolase (beta-lactamase superfamily II)
MKFDRALAVVLFLSSIAVAADPANFTLKQVGKGVYAAIALPGGKAGSNAGFVIGSNGVLVVDSFLDVAPAQELLAAIREMTSLPIRYVVNTHYHLDHTGGNRIFAEAGAAIIAQKNVRAWLHTENLKFFGATPTAEQKGRVEALVPPDIAYSDAVDLYLGDRLVEVRYMLGHTGGDSVVIVPDAKVVFTGDLFWDQRLPNLIDASTKPWVDTLQQLTAQHADARFVSGHGDVGSATDVQDFRRYLLFLRERVAEAQREGKSENALEDAVLPQLQAKYGSWGSFSNFAKPNIEQTAAELAGTKRIPTAQ